MSDYMNSISWLNQMVFIFLLISTSTVFAQTPQERVHQMAHRVMPFDLEKTVHIFKMTESGGVQKVLAKDADDEDQIALIQRHLKQETLRFQHGDYSDPEALHSADMPGLKDLQSGASVIEVSYQALSMGAEITFKAKDIHLITAIHRWFGAQLSEHGADAKAE